MLKHFKQGFPVLQNYANPSKTVAYSFQIFDFCITGFDISRSGSCVGYSWDIAWTTKGGDQPPLNVSGEGLQGTEPRVVTQPVRHGGTWIRPLRGDMLLEPKDMPQV